MSSQLRAFLLFCLLVTGLGALAAQTYERAFGLEVSPHYGGGRISAGAGVPFQQLERQDSVETGLGGFGFGLIFESRADKIGFTTGVRYIDTGYEVIENGLNGPTIGEDFREEVRAQYLSIPFELNFHQDVTEKNRISFLLGVAANLHLKTTAKRTNFLDGDNLGTVVVPDDPETDFRPVVLSLNTGVAFDRKLGDNWAVKLQPFFSFFLQGNLQENFNALNRNYYQTGVRVTVKRVFL